MISKIVPKHLQVIAYDFTFHPFVWRLRWVKPAREGRKVVSHNGSSYWWVSIGPFTIAESYLL